MARKSKHPFAKRFVWGVTHRWYRENWQKINLGDWECKITNVANLRDPATNIYGVITKTGNWYFSWKLEGGAIRIWDKSTMVDLPRADYAWAYEWVDSIIGLFSKAWQEEFGDRPRSKKDGLVLLHLKQMKKGDPSPNVKPAPPAEELREMLSLMKNTSGVARGYGISRPTAKRWLATLTPGDPK